MSDSLLMLLEMIEEEMFPSMKNITPVAQSNDDIGYMKSKGTKKEVKAGVLDVKRIVDAIVSRYFCIQKNHFHPFGGVSLLVILKIAPVICLQFLCIIPTSTPSVF